MHRFSLLMLMIAPVAWSGCGGGSSSSSRPGAAAAVTSSTTGGTTSGSTTTLVDVHGELVTVPALAGGAALAFLQDGATSAREVFDPAALVAAGLHEGHSLVLSGAVRTNGAGRSALLEALDVSAFLVDDLVGGGQLRAGVPSAGFEHAGGAVYHPMGPLAAALVASPPDRPVFVTGRVLPGPRTQVGQPLTVTSWRPAVRLSWVHTTPLIGFSSFRIDDLEGAGAYRVHSFSAVRPSGRQDIRGDGRQLDATVLADLRARLTAANLSALPSSFQPPQVFPDSPITTITYEDAQGEVSILIRAGATLPPAFDALVQLLAALSTEVPTFVGLEQGVFSDITQPGAEAARDLTAWTALWARHAPRAPRPTVDFTRKAVVGVFDGQRPTGGFDIEIVGLTRIGPVIHLDVKRTSPTGVGSAVLTWPYHLVEIDLGGQPADFQVEGVRLP